MHRSRVWIAILIGAIIGMMVNSFAMEYVVEQIADDMFGKEAQDKQKAYEAASKDEKANREDQYRLLRLMIDREEKDQKADAAQEQAAPSEWPVVRWGKKVKKKIESMSPRHHEKIERLKVSGDTDDIFHYRRMHNLLHEAAHDILPLALVSMIFEYTAKRYALLKTLCVSAPQSLVANRERDDLLAIGTAASITMYDSVRNISTGTINRRSEWGSEESIANFCVLSCGNVVITEEFKRSGNTKIKLFARCGEFLHQATIPGLYVQQLLSLSNNRLGIVVDDMMESSSGTTGTTHELHILNTKLGLQYQSTVEKVSLCAELADGRLAAIGSSKIKLYPAAYRDSSAGVHPHILEMHKEKGRQNKAEIGALIPDMHGGFLVARYCADAKKTHMTQWDIDPDHESRLTLRHYDVDHTLYVRPLKRLSDGNLIWSTNDHSSPSSLCVCSADGMHVIEELDKVPRNEPFRVAVAAHWFATNGGDDKVKIWVSVQDALRAMQQKEKKA